MSKFENRNRLIKFEYYNVNKIIKNNVITENEKLTEILNYKISFIIKNLNIVNLNKCYLEINNILDKIHKNILDNFDDKTFSNFKKLFIIELQNLLIYIFNGTKINNFYKNTKLYCNFLKNGIKVFDLDNLIINKINSILQNDILNIKKKKIKANEIRGSNYDRSKIIFNDSLKSYLYKIFLNKEIFNIYERYFNKKYENNINITLHISDQEDEHYKLTYHDNLDISSKTLNSHFDPKNNILKLILYLKDVNKEDGPFCYIPKSNLWDKDIENNPVKYLSSKVNGVTNYLENEEKINNMRFYPSKLSYYNVFGNLLKKDDKLTEIIEKNENSILSNNYKNNLILFDPNGIHRGGICKNNGKRISLQISIF